VAGRVFHGILYHLVSSCQEVFCPVLGIGGIERAELSSGIAKGNSKPAALKPKAAAPGLPYNSAEMCAEVGFVSSNLSPTR